MCGHETTFYEHKITFQTTSILLFQAQEQLQADVLRYKAKIEDLEKELTLKGQVHHAGMKAFA